MNRNKTNIFIGLLIYSALVFSFISNSAPTIFSPFCSSDIPHGVDIMQNLTPALVHLTPEQKKIIIANLLQMVWAQNQFSMQQNSIATPSEFVSAQVMVEKIRQIYALPFNTPLPELRFLTSTSLHQYILAFKSNTSIMLDLCTLDPFYTVDLIDHNKAIRLHQALDETGDEADAIIYNLIAVIMYSPDVYQELRQSSGVQLRIGLPGNIQSINWHIIPDMVAQKCATPSQRIMALHQYLLGLADTLFTDPREDTTLVLRYIVGQNTIGDLISFYAAGLNSGRAPAIIQWEQLAAPFVRSALITQRSITPPRGFKRAPN